MTMIQSALDSYIYGFERQRSNLSYGDDAEFAARPFDDTAAFEFGLDLVIEGLERLLERTGTDVEAG